MNSENQAYWGIQNILKQIIKKSNALSKYGKNESKKVLVIRFEHPVELIDTWLNSYNLLPTLQTILSATPCNDYKSYWEHPLAFDEILIVSREMVCGINDQSFFHANHRLTEYFPKIHLSSNNDKHWRFVKNQILSKKPYNVA